MRPSVLTIVRNRTEYLANLLEGVRRSSLQPGEVIVLDPSGEPVAEKLDQTGVRFERREIDGLPLAQAFRMWQIACIVKIDDDPKSSFGFSH